MARLLAWGLEFGVDSSFQNAAEYIIVVLNAMKICESDSNLAMTWLETGKIVDLCHISDKKADI